MSFYNEEVLADMEVAFGGVSKAMLARLRRDFPELAKDLSFPLRAGWKEKIILSPKRITWTVEEGIGSAKKGKAKGKPRDYQAQLDRIEEAQSRMEAKLDAILRHIGKEVRI